MQKFGLELHPEKTRLIEFGRFAEEDRKRRGGGKPKPETFDFLEFTHVAERPERATGSRFDGRPRRSGCGANCRQLSRNYASAGTIEWSTTGSGCGRWCTDTLTIMLSRATSRRCGRSSGRWLACDWRRFGGAANGIAIRGNGFGRLWSVSCLHRASGIRYRGFASTPCTRGKSRMR